MDKITIKKLAEISGATEKTIGDRLKDFEKMSRMLEDD
jgi:hypothetical protein